MTKRVLHVGADRFTIPLEAAVETFGVLGKRGSGKSNGAVVLAEEMYDAGLPWVAIDPKGDWWGIRSSADGKGPGLSVPVFGGDHGDLPLEVTSGNFVADLVVSERLSCVLDCSTMSQGGRDRFLADFGQRLYEKNREPLHVFLDEAHDYVPQQVSAKRSAVVGAWTTLVTQGRFRGLGVTAITQRPARIHNDVLTQVETLLVYRITAAPDIEAIRKWVKYHEVGEELLGQLSSMANGRCWLWSPHWLEKIEPVQFRRRRTFDSGATPKMGEQRQVPKRLADVDIEAIKAQMADSIERVKADNPVELRRRISELEGLLRVAQSATPEPVEVPVEVPVPFVPERLKDAYDELAGAAAEATQFLASSEGLQRRIERAHTEAANAAAEAFRDAPAVPARPQPRTPLEPLVVPAGRTVPPAVLPPSAAPDTGEGRNYRAGARRLLEAVAQWGTITRRQAASIADLRRSAFNAYLGELRRDGLLEDDGTMLTITDAGRALSGIEPVPKDPDSVLAYWRPKLRKGAREMLDIIVERRVAVAKDALAEMVVLKRSAFNAYLGDLRRANLIGESPADVWLAEWLR